MRASPDSSQTFHAARQPGLAPLIAGTLRLMAGRPTLLVPFGLLTGIQAVGLLAFVWAPQSPLSFLWNPAIEAFFGDAALGSPGRWILLPQLFHYVEVPLALLFGPLMTGTVIAGTAALQKEPDAPALRTAWPRAFSRYFSLTLAGLVAFFLARLLYRSGLAALQAWAGPGESPAPALLALSFVSGAAVELALIYAAAAVIIQDVSLWKAPVNSLKTAWQNPGSAVFLMVGPLGLLFAAAAFKSALPVLATQSSPAVVFAVFGIHLAASWLLNTFVAVAAALLVLSRVRARRAVFGAVPVFA
jgi:hypothetical protein